MSRHGVLPRSCKIKSRIARSTSSIGRSNQSRQANKRLRKAASGRDGDLSPFLGHWEIAYRVRLDDDGVLLVLGYFGDVLFEPAIQEIHRDVAVAVEFRVGLAVQCLDQRLAKGPVSPLFLFKGKLPPGRGCEHDEPVLIARQ